MRLHENRQLFRQAVQFTAQQMNIPAIYIEKDYWVTYALHTIFHNEIGKETVFKGGTALSKCFGLIERFSEDIDLVVLSREGESNYKISKKIKEVSDVVASVLPEVEIEGVTRKRGMNRKTAHTYAKEFQGNYGRIRDFIVIEATCLGYFEPSTTRMISSYVYDMMVNNGQEGIAKEYGLLPFEVSVLEPVRTLCEKIMSLVRFSYSEDYMEDLKNKIRHMYDLHQLLQNKELSDFFDSQAFAEMLIKVANDDVISYKNNNEWLIYHPNKARLFADLDTIWQQLKVTYSGDFKNLMYGIPPDEKSIYTTLFRIRARLEDIRWKIKID